MSRVRIGYVIACFGILITTGGCAESATAPSAANIEASASRFKNPYTEPVAETPATGDSDDDDGYTTLNSGLLNGGGRVSEMP